MLDNIDDDDDDQPIWAVQGECRVGVQLAADLLDAGDRQLIKCSSFTKLFLKQTLFTDNRSNQMKLIKTNKKTIVTSECPIVVQFSLGFGASLESCFSVNTENLKKEEDTFLTDRHFEY